MVILLLSLCAVRVFKIRQHIALGFHNESTGGEGANVCVDANERESTPCILVYWYEKKSAGGQEEDRTQAW